jgi:DNA-binding NtrC family response regulator
MNTMIRKVYVVDDDASIREAVSSLVRSAGLQARTFASAQDAWIHSRIEPPDCMVLDVDLPGLSGLEFQQRLVRERASIPIIFLTGKGDIPMSVRAIKAGAIEFLTKPFAGEHLLAAIQLGVEQTTTINANWGRENVQWTVDGSEIQPDYPSQPQKRRKDRELSPVEQIVGKSARLKAALLRVEKVGPTDTTVLITGETGTGKELIARAIHNSSRRASGPFIAVNCGAIPQALIASELFGHEKGAFTGALHRRLGRFESAQGGTIFLDEIGELPPEMQVALLRVLQEREFERLGGSEVIRSNVRVIAATHRDLKQQMIEGKFRSDLFYRLNVFPVEIPALRDRREDIPLLVDYFIRCYSGLSGRHVRRIDPTSLEHLVAHTWPGNIRELQNVIERSLITHEGDTLVVEESFPQAASLSSHNNPQHLAGKIAAQEREIIEQALQQCKGRVSGPWGAAAKLGIPPSTLDSKIFSLKIDKHRFRVISHSVVSI